MFFDDILLGSVAVSVDSLVENSFCTISIRLALRENERAVQELNDLKEGFYGLKTAFEEFEQRLDQAKANSKSRGGALLKFDEVNGLAGLLMLSS